MNLVDRIAQEQLRKDVPNFRSGDTVRVYCKIREGDKERVQLFEGVCIRRHRASVGSSFTVRKVSYGVGVERVFPMHSPLIDRIEVAGAGRVRRSRLYYLRNLSGKAARIEGRRVEVAQVEEIEAEVTSDDGAADEAAAAD